jgi:hypothetical protein
MEFMRELTQTDYPKFRRNPRKGVRDMIYPVTGFHPFNFTEFLQINHEISASRYSVKKSIMRSPERHVTLYEAAYIVDPIYHDYYYNQSYNKLAFRRD